MNKKINKKYYIFEMDITKLNIISLLILVLMVIVTIFLYPKNLAITFYETNMVLLFSLYIIWMLLHEILHSISYVLYGGDFKKIVYGGYLEKGVLYCLCKQNISRKNILNSLMFPLFYIGIVTYIIAIIFELPLLLFLSIANISGAAGDIIMFLYISRLNKNIEFSEFDNPIQFAIYSDDDVTKTPHFGLNHIETTDSLKREELTKIKISKFTIIFFVIIILLLLLGYIL